MELRLVEVELPQRSDDRTVWPRLLHRAGNREAVAFIWEGDAAYEDGHFDEKHSEPFVFTKIPSTFASPHCATDLNS